MEEVVAEHLRVEHAHALGRERACGRCRRRRARRCRRTECRARAPCVSARSRGVRPDALRARTGRRSPARSGAARLALAPSRCRSSSAASVFSISATISRGRILSAVGCVRSTSAAIAFSSAMSPAICLLDVRAQHLDHDFARRVVAGSVAACTCAIDAEASGVVSNSRTLRRSALPSARSIERARGVAVERRDAVLQQRQFVGDVRRHQVAARGQDLAELDEDRARAPAAPGAGARRATARRSSPTRAARTGASAAASVRPACRRAGRRGDSAAARGRCARRAAPAVMRALPRSAQAAHARGETFDVVAQGVDVVEEGVQFGAARPRRAIPR